MKVNMSLEDGLSPTTRKTTTTADLASSFETALLRAKANAEVSKAAVKSGVESGQVSELALSHNAGTPLTKQKETDPMAKYISPAQQEFFDFAKMTLAQRIRAAVLKELGVTEEDLKNLSPEARAAMEKTIAERVRERMEAISAGKSSEGDTNSVFQI